MKLDEIAAHEKQCPERTVVCGYRDCSKDIQLKDYVEHAMTMECAIDLERIEDYEYYKGGTRVQFENKFIIMKIALL